MSGLRRWLTAVALAAWLPPAAPALDSHRAFSQYIHDQWSSEQGFAAGAVYAITEAADGYLWIGTERGLVRFDGLNFQLFNHANAPALPASPVLGLNTDAEGNLWVRLQSPGLLRYRDGVFHSVFPDTSPELGVTAMGRGLRGGVLLARAGDPVRYRGGKIEPIAPDVASTRRLVISIAESRDGAIWMGTRDAGLFSVRDGGIFVPAGLPDRKVNCLLPGSGPELWIGTDSGLIRWDGGALTVSGVPRSLRDVQVLALVRDRESNVWVGTANGLVRIDAQGVSVAQHPAGGLTGPVNALFEDRDGNLWVGRTQGIERYRDSVFLSYSSLTARRGESGGPIYVDSAGRTWFGPSGGGLSWVVGTESGRFTGAGVEHDVVYSIDGAPGELWLGRQRGGLTHLRDQGGAVSALETYTTAAGLSPGSVFAVHRSRDGTVWAGTLGGGVSRIRRGRIITYTTANGLASNTILAIEEGADGTMWFATPNGLNAFEGGRWRRYSGQQGLPPGRVACLAADADGVLWIGTDLGLAFIRAGQVQTPQGLPDSLLEEVLGIADDGRGALWVATSKHVIRAARARLLGGPPGVDDVREFGLADGMPAAEGVRRQRSVTTDRLGRVWFSLEHGISVVDPARLLNQSAPAIVRIQDVSADGRSIKPAALLHVPAARQRITFSFTGLSLSVPERVRFSYRLDNFDRAWSQPSAAREAGYTNLSPGTYRFRVIASNSDGIWNSAEAAIAVEMTPAVWQTWWFRLLVVAACVAAVLAIYRFRLHQLTRQLNLRFEERLAERTRIAQDLHDTLLQGLLSASMQLHVAVDGVPAGLPAKAQLNRVLQLMRQVVGEGRNAVRGLRSPGEGIADLEGALSRIREENLVPAATDFRVIVEGRGRALNPLLRDEVYRIGREALVNAFRHSGAAQVEMELDYDDAHLRLLVRDNGTGIDAQVLRSGRDGHWGLVGMRERAERIGAQLKVRSRHAAGTEVELTVPGHIAFADRRRTPQEHPGRENQR